MREEITIGGQAVVEGVLMRTKTHYAVAVRNPKKKIVVKKERVNSLARRSRIFLLPFFRGVAAMVETLSLGFGALMYSANISADDDKKLSRREMAFTVGFSIVLAVGIFVALPFFVADLVTSDSLALNIVDGVIRLVALVAYLLFISFFKDVRRMFQYHGAEHMTIHAYEKGKALTYRNISRFKTMHARCGTSFLLIVFIVSLVFFSVIVFESALMNFSLRILLIPLIAGVSYELLKFSAKHQGNFLIGLFTMPGIWLQYITTKRPDRDQVEVAVASLKALTK